MSSFVYSPGAQGLAGAGTGAVAGTVFSSPASSALEAGLVRDGLHHPIRRRPSEHRFLPAEIFRISEACEEYLQEISSLMHREGSDAVIALKAVIDVIHPLTDEELSRTSKIQMLAKPILNLQLGLKKKSGDFKNKAREAYLSMPILNFLRQVNQLDMKLFNMYFNALDRRYLGSQGDCFTFIDEGFEVESPEPASEMKSIGVSLISVAKGERIGGVLVRSRLETLAKSALLIACQRYLENTSILKFKHTEGRKTVLGLKAIIEAIPSGISEEVILRMLGQRIYDLQFSDSHAKNKTRKRFLGAAVLSFLNGVSDYLLSLLDARGIDLTATRNSLRRVIERQAAPAVLAFGEVWIGPKSNKKSEENRRSGAAMLQLVEKF